MVRTVFKPQRFKPRSINSMNFYLLLKRYFGFDNQNGDTIINQHNDAQHREY
jgi:hypothetical protein